MTETSDIEKAALAAVDAKDLTIPTDQDPQSYRMIAYAWAGGATKDQIALMTGVDVDEVGKVLKLERIQKAVQEIRQRAVGNDFDLLFKKMAPDAAETLREVMQNRAANDSTRVGAATAILDRGMGRPKQNVEVGGSLIRQLLERLEDEKETREIEGTAKRVDTEDGDFREVDPVETWVKENL